MSPFEPRAKIVVFGIAAAAIAAAAALLAYSGGSAHAQASAPAATPAACTCSQPHTLAGPSGPSLIYNCQCGGLQCVASVFTPPTRPDGNGPSLVCVR